MKNLSVFISSVLLLLIFTSCQKEISADTGSGNNNNDSTDFKVRTYTESFTSLSDSSSQTFNLSYDDGDRILALVDATDSANRFVYSYAADSYTMDLYNAGILSIHENFFLNNIPLVDSTLQYDDTNDTTVEKSIYNAAGNLIQQKSYDYTTAGGSQLYEMVDYTYDVNGNVTQENDNAGTITTYEYTADLNTVDVGLKYLPKNKNLTKKTTITDGASSTVIDHTYTFDSNHRILSERQEYSTGDIVIKSYTY